MMSHPLVVRHEGGGLPWPVRSVGVLLSVILSLFTPGDARASGEAIQQCVKQHQATQIAKRDGKLLEARSKALSCASSECPAVIRRDCASISEELNASIPSIVVLARLEGEDVINVKLSVDGKVVTQTLDGRPLELDPGTHLIRLEHGKLPVITQRILTTVGDRNRVMRFTLRDPEAEKRREAERRKALARRRDEAKARGEKVPSVPMHRPVPVGVWVTGSIGLVGLATFGTMATIGQIEKGSLEECDPFCTDDDVRMSRTMFLGGDIALGVGVAGLTTALIWYALRPEVPLEQPVEGALVPELDISPRHAGLRLKGRF